MQERLRLIALGHTDIVDDLRKLNKGRPGMFDTFFGTLSEVVEEVVAANERRHNVAHLSQWLSLKELRSTAAARCEEGDAVPSVATIRLQFNPRNKYTPSSLKFTSRIPV